jgi:uncharacterized membrane protein
MRRVNLFLIILIAALTALITLTAVGFAIFTSSQATQQNPSNWMGQMWSGSSGMMGQTSAAQTATNPLLSYFGVLFAVMIGLIVVGIIGLAYYLLYPQIRIGIVQPQTTFKIISPQVSSETSQYNAVSKTLTEEERKIINVLTAHNGKYLQKYIRNETGLSRLKTHRIIARLADRGIVSLEKTGNTNQVFLADWLQK